MEGNTGRRFELQSTASNTLWGYEPDVWLAGLRAEVMLFREVGMRSIVGLCNFHVNA